MQRRDFMAGSAATATLGVAGWPVYAEINAGSPVPKRIALVHPYLRWDQMTSGRVKAYFQELDRLGYIEGKNLVVERYSVLGRHDRTPSAVFICISHPARADFALSDRWEGAC
jgi:hypothetical protein